MSSGKMAANAPATLIKMASSFISKAWLLIVTRFLHRSGELEQSSCLSREISLCLEIPEMVTTVGQKKYR